jgi:DNA polymerase beta
MVNYKDVILENLRAMRKLETDKKEKFKALAYSKVIKELEKLTSITSIADLDGVQGIGKGIKRKIEEIIETGALQNAAPVIDKMADEKCIETLSKVMNIGPVKAKELCEKHNIRSIEELQAREDLLNDKQKLGLKYVDDFQKRIPRKEMDKHNLLIGNIMTKLNETRDDKITYTIAGSFRRGLKDSGDIDVLVSCNAKDFMETLVAQLESQKYISDTFAKGSGKYMGACRLSRHRTTRRIDIVYINPKEYAFALLYFTGSQIFNIKMRKIALEKGYSLSEHGLKYSKGPQKNEFVTNYDFKTEEDIFKFLEMEYVSPDKRV